MLLNQLQQSRMDCRPDGTSTHGGGRPLGELLIVKAQWLAEPGHILNGHLNSKVERLSCPSVNDADWSCAPRIGAVSAAEVSRNLFEGSLCGGKADALDRL